MQPSTPATVTGTAGTANFVLAGTNPSGVPVVQSSAFTARDRRLADRARVRYLYASSPLTFPTWRRFRSRSFQRFGAGGSLYLASIIPRCVGRLTTLAAPRHQRFARFLCADGPVTLQPGDYASVTPGACAAPRHRTEYSPSATLTTAAAAFMPGHEHASLHAAQVSASDESPHVAQPVRRNHSRGRSGAGVPAPRTPLSYSERGVPSQRSVFSRLHAELTVALRPERDRSGTVDMHAIDWNTPRVRPRCRRSRSHHRHR